MAHEAVSISWEDLTGPSSKSYSLVGRIVSQRGRGIFKGHLFS